MRPRTRSELEAELAILYEELETMRDRLDELLDDAEPLELGDESTGVGEVLGEQNEDAV